MEEVATQYIRNTFEKSVDEKTVEETRKIKFIISTGQKDRHKHVLNMDNWQLDDYNANPIVGYQHNVYGDNMCLAPNPDDVIGKGSAEVDTYKGKKVLVSDVEFEPAAENPIAEKVFRKVLRGTLNAASVGILPIGGFKRENKTDDDGNIVDTTLFWGGQHLLEWSVVNIPANPGALRHSLKNHTNAALSFVQTLLQDYGIKDIKSMRVQEILDIIAKKYKDAPTGELEIELSGPDPDFEKYKLRLKQIQK